MKHPIATGRGRTVALAAAMLIALYACGSGARPAHAASCSDMEISARGEPASFKWLALVKARGNWRSKVRAMPALGADYANYGRAADPIERCISDSRSIVCTVAARPCRP